MDWQFIIAWIKAFEHVKILNVQFLSVMCIVSGHLTLGLLCYACATLNLSASCKQLDPDPPAKPKFCRALHINILTAVGRASLFSDSCCL